MNSENKNSENKNSKKQGFRYLRVIRFQETDAAGVIYFANLLNLCHEAFEASLAHSGIDLANFFSKDNGTAVPIVHTEADFYRPLRCGDTVVILVCPIQLKSYSFENHYEIFYPNADPSQDNGAPLVATAQTTHVCINTVSARKTDLSNHLLQWIAATGDAIAPSPSELNN